MNAAGISRTEKMIARKDGPIGWIVFNNPARRNAVSVEMWEALAEIVDDYARDPAIRVIVARGAGGKAFVSGADISEFEQKRSTPERTEAYRRISERGGEALRLVGKPTIAMIEGFCIGGGVSLARSIVVQPSVLLLDEPLSNLDANLREEMRFEIRRLHDEFNITMVYVTHDQAEAMVTSDRIAVMNKGRIEQIDKPFEIYCKPKTAFVAGFIGRTNFLEGRLRGGEVDFGGFALPGRVLGGELPEQVKVSVRPQCIHLHRRAPAAADDRFCVSARIDQRAYLGESWDYQIRIPGLSEPLRVTARPQEVFEMNEDVVAEIDATQVTVIE